MKNAPTWARNVTNKPIVLGSSSCRTPLTSRDRRAIWVRADWRRLTCSVRTEPGFLGLPLMLNAATALMYCNGTFMCSRSLVAGSAVRAWCRRRLGDPVRACRSCGSLWWPYGERDNAARPVSACSRSPGAARWAAAGSAWRTPPVAQPGHGDGWCAGARRPLAQHQDLDVLQAGAGSPASLASQARSRALSTLPIWLRGNASTRSARVGQYHSVIPRPDK